MLRFLTTAVIYLKHARRCSERRPSLYVAEFVQQFVLVVALEDGHIDILMCELLCDLEAHATQVTTDNDCL